MMEVNSDPLRQALPDISLRITIEKAVWDFLRDEDARQLAKTTAIGKMWAISMRIQETTKIKIRTGRSFIPTGSARETALVGLI